MSGQQYHLDEGPDRKTMRHLSKEQFGRKLHRLMVAREWTQAELARRVDLPRDRISTYVRGVHSPSDENVARLAKVFDMTPEELLPNLVEKAVTYDRPAVDLRISESDSSVAWLRVNRAVTHATAARILALLAEDKADETANAS